MRRRPPQDLLLFCAGRDQLDLLAPQFDFKIITGLQAEQGGVGLANQQVADALHRGHIAEGSAAFASALSAAIAQADALGLQQGFIEGCEILAFAAFIRSTCCLRSSSAARRA